jgi:threonylcarbamoyladenosine tRNA methylthiotransferase MtaB
MTGPVGLRVRRHVSTRRCSPPPEPRDERRRWVTFGCRLNAYESEVIRRQAERRGGACDRGQHLRGDRRGGAAIAQAIRKLARERPGAHRGHRLRRADRARDLRRHAEVALVLGNEEKLSAESGAARDCWRAPFGLARGEVVVNDIMAVTETART